MLSPFEEVLGDAFRDLPAAVQRIHSLRAPLLTAGRADIDAAKGFLASALALIAGLPRAGRNVEVSVLFEPLKMGGEHWDRRFGARRYRSSLEAGRGRDLGFLIEHFAVFDLKFHLTPEKAGLRWSLAGWRLLGVPLPRWGVPRIDCFESGDGDRFCFDIDVAFPLIGWLMSYRGALVDTVNSE